MSTHSILEEPLLSIVYVLLRTLVQIVARLLSIVVFCLGIVHGMFETARRFTPYCFAVLREYDKMNWELVLTRDISV